MSGNAKGRTEQEVEVLFREVNAPGVTSETVLGGYDKWADTYDVVKRIQNLFCSFSGFPFLIMLIVCMYVCLFGSITAKHDTKSNTTKLLTTIVLTQALPRES